MNPRQADKLIQSTFNDAWKDFYTRIPHEPHVASIPEDILGSSTSNWKSNVSGLNKRIIARSRWGHDKPTGNLSETPVLDGGYPLAEQAASSSTAENRKVQVAFEPSQTIAYRTLPSYRSAKRSATRAKHRGEGYDVDRQQWGSVNGERGAHLWGREVQAVPPYAFCVEIKENVWVQEQPVSCLTVMALSWKLSKLTSVFLTPLGTAISAYFPRCDQASLQLQSIWYRP